MRSVDIIISYRTKNSKSQTFYFGENAKFDANYREIPRAAHFGAYMQAGTAADRQMRSLIVVDSAQKIVGKVV